MPFNQLSLTSRRKKSVSPAACNSDKLQYSPVVKFLAFQLMQLASNAPEIICNGRVKSQNKLGHMITNSSIEIGNLSATVLEKGRAIPFPNSTQPFCLDTRFYFFHWSQ